MKTWKMTKELTENPDKESISYMKKGFRDVLKAQSIKGAIRFSNEEDNWHEVLIGVDLDREWEEIKKPVDFMTAIQSEKPMSVEFSGTKIKKETLANMLYRLQENYSDKTIKQIIVYGNWYIED